MDVRFVNLSLTQVQKNRFKFGLDESRVKLRQMGFMWNLDFGCLSIQSSLNHLNSPNRLRGLTSNLKVEANQARSGPSVLTGIKPKGAWGTSIEPSPTGLKFRPKLSLFSKWPQTGRLSSFLATLRPFSRNRPVLIQS